MKFVDRGVDMSITRDGNTINVEVSSVKFDDYDQIRTLATDVIKESEGSLEMVFKDTMTVNSALIGYLIKLTKVDNIKLSVKVGNVKLYEMLNTLSLVDVLNVSKL